MARIFISHASPDRSFALQLARSLEQLDHVVWIDAQQIQVGDGIPQRIAEAVERADYLVAVLSARSIASAWCEAEWNAKYWEEIVRRQPLVLPVLLETCPIPFFLQPKRHADFRFEYAVGLAQLAIVLHEATSGKLMYARERAFHALAPPPPSHHLLSSDPPVWYAVDRMKNLGELVEVNVALALPYIGSITGVWKPDEHEQDAAWELYIELTTRISVAELSPSDGLLRESLSSLYGIFTTTRQLLRQYGPRVARPKEENGISFGYLAITMLNYVLRPVLAKWHPLLLDYEYKRDAATSPLEHEQAWERANELRTALNNVRSLLMQYTNLLADISHIPTQLPEPSATSR